MKKKKQKKWLIYAYYPDNKEIVACQWGGRNKKTAQKLRDKLKDLGISYDEICSDDWHSFITVFKVISIKLVKNTLRILKGKTRFCNIVSADVRKTCLFSKEVRKSSQNL